jgi:DNA primase
VWYDFSSSRGGDVFSFVMEIEGLDFRGVLELLARKAGVDMSLYENAGHDMSKQKQRLQGLLELAQSYYQQTLMKNQRAIDYVFIKRGLNKKVVQDFGIGFAPESRSAVVNFLAKKGYSKSEIQGAGMSNQHGGDLFRSRIMISLCDSAGQLIGFTGRYLGLEKNAPKYLNTPQTLLYDKSRHVFGLHLAKEAIRTQDQAVLVEGNLDVVSSHQVGVMQVVAAAGTALTEQHLRTLKRFSSTIILALDNDKAGLAATERTIPIAQQLEVNLKIISLPGEAKDPDELIQESADAWRAAINANQPVVDWVLSEYEQRNDMASAEGKRQFSTASLAVIKNLKDPIEQDHYAQIVAKKTNASLSAVEAKLHQTIASVRSTPLKKVAAKAAPQGDVDSHQEALLSLAAAYPSVRALLIELDDEDSMQPEAQTALQFLRAHPDTIMSDPLPEPLHKIDTYVKILLFRADARYGAWSDLDRYDETAKLVKLIKNETKQQKKEQLMNELRHAEELGDVSTIQLLRQELSQLIKEIG